jgi:DNA repair exonuclease SbcCD ATPase subunit
MTKITKNEYQAKKMEIETKIIKLENLLKSLPLETEGIPQHIVNLIGDTWNATHDEIEELENELQFLDQQWNRRDWTQQEYNEWELISDNID